MDSNFYVYIDFIVNSVLFLSLLVKNESFSFGNDSEFFLQ